MNSENKCLQIFILAGLLLLLYAQINFWSSQWLGVVILASYVALLSHLWHEILAKVFRFKKNRVFTFVLGFLAAFFIHGVINSMFIIFYELNDITIWVSFVLGSSILLLLNIYTPVYKVRLTRSHSKEGVLKKYSVFTRHNLLIILYVIFWLFSFYLLYNSQSQAFLNSPWKVVDKYFLYSFFGATLILFGFLLSKHQTKTILFVIIAHSVLIHMYLPLSHELPWGGDVWRHVGEERYIMQNNPVRPGLFGDNIDTVEVGSVRLPKILFQPQQYSYGFNWGSAVSLAEVLKIDLVYINKWLLPLIWAISIPVIFFNIGLVLFGSLKESVWMSASTLLPFSFQALGSFTLPVSIGYLMFFFILMLWLLYLRDRKSWQIKIVSAFTFLLFFTYLLHAIVLASVIILTLILDYISEIKSKIFKLSTQIAIVLMALVVIPVIELVGGISNFLKSIYLSNAFFEIIGVFSGWNFTILATAQDRLIGNIIFNHTPNYAFVGSIFTDYRYQIFGVMVGLWILFFVGIYYLIKNKDIKWKSIGILTSMTVGGYIIGWFFMQGDHLLVRRLDVMFAAVMMIVSLLGGVSLLKYFEEKIKSGAIIKFALFVGAVIFSWFVATVYASGPDSQVMSIEQYQTSQHIWNNIDKQPKNKCILSDTWVLLGIESLSASKVVGGGFPIDYQFAQPKRVEYYENMFKNPNKNILKDLYSLTQSDICWLALPENRLSKQKIDKINDVVGSGSKYVSGYVIWEAKKLNL